MAGTVHAAIWVLAVACAVVAHRCQGEPTANRVMPPIVHLAVDGKTPDVGSDAVVGVTHAPKFSWRMDGLPLQRATGVSAVRVLVGETDDVAASVVWDSGKTAVKTGVMSLKYAGAPLKSLTTYYWRMYWWNHDGVVSSPSATQRFHTGLDTWNASWVGSTTDNVYRKDFLLMTVPTEATVAVTGLGWFQLYLNGQRVSQHELGPGWTRYTARVAYFVYNITAFLQAGPNTFGIELGYGWRNSTSFPSRDDDPVDPYLRVFRLHAQMGNTQVVSDGSWKSTTGPVVQDSVYDGETYDARLEQSGWNEPGFANLSAWNVAQVVPGPGGAMSLSLIPHVAVRQEMPAQTTNVLDDSNYVIDFGQNFAGRCRLRVTGPAGAVITLRHAEVLMHEPYGPANGDVYMGNLRTARQTDTYILKGAGSVESFEPMFTYHGFRYVKVSGWPGFKSATNVTAVHFYSAVEDRSTFKTSSIVVNQIQHNVIWGQRSNLMTIPTDCDQRDERLGWMGDAGLSSGSMGLNFHMEAFHENYLWNIRDEMDAAGSIPDVVPEYRYGFRPADPSWSLAFPVILHDLYSHYGDMDAVQTHWSALLQYLDNLSMQLAKAGGSLRHMPAYYGDWVTPGQVDPVSIHYPAAASYLDALSKAIDLADALGQSANVTALTKLYDSLVENFNDAWLFSNNTYANGGQTSYAIALALGVVPESLQFNMSIGLLHNIITTMNTHVFVGIIGAKALFPALHGMQRVDVALDLAEQTTYPSWGYMTFNTIEPGTTVWELWDAPIEGPGMNSRNHHMFSSISYYLLRYFGGITSAGCTIAQPNAAFAPAQTQGLSWAESSLISQCGTVSISWQRHGGAQCGRSPENQSVRSPLLPKHPELVLDCGSKGGVITDVTFASFGTPLGTCGAFGIMPECHAANSSSAIAALCVGLVTCTIPTDTVFWGDPCPNIIKSLFVQVQCSATDTLTADVVVPAGSGAELVVPTFGLGSVGIMADATPIWLHGAYRPGVSGIYNATWIPDRRQVLITCGSGAYSFEATGIRGASVCDFVAEGQSAVLSCPPGQVITRIDFASFGTPVGNCTTTMQRGICHAGSSQHVVEHMCLSRQSCVIPATDSLFIDPCVGTVKSLGVAASCATMA